MRTVRVTGLRAIYGNRRYDIKCHSILWSMLLFVFVQPVFALPFTFTRIAAASIAFPQVGAWDLNDAGMVAYQRTKPFPNNNFTELYYGNGIPSSSVLVVKTGDTAPDNRLFDYLGYADINNKNVVSFRGIFGNPSPGDGIFTGSGGPVTQIHLGTGLLGNTTINNNGKVAFIDHSVSTIYEGGPLAGPLTTVASVGLTYTGLGSIPGINDSDTAAFYAILNSGISEIRTSTSPFTTPTVIENGGATKYFGQVTPINNSGRVLYVEGDYSTNIETMYVDNGPTRSFIADNAGITNSSPAGYIGFNRWDFNDFNDVVFEAGRPGSLGGGTGIYMGPNSITDKLIEPGDFLFGKPVFSLGLGGINNSCQVSFTANFLQGNSLTSEAYRADPQFDCGTTSVPEPSSIALILAGLLVLTLRSSGTAQKRRSPLALLQGLPRLSSRTYPE